MTPAPDPYRILGVGAGASLNEIRSAYRRLVKQYHPDAAGERALPRFLSIQAAYERLVDGEGRLRSPWRARPSASGAAAARSETPSSPGAPPRASRREARPRRGAAGAGAAGAGATEEPRRARGQASGGARSAAGGPETKRHRASRKATPGSTTYDEAKETPLDPPWDGGAWYGPSSGTFWTLNPREYADPRKHGPEYEARARRALRRKGSGEPGRDPGDPAGTS